LGTRLGPEVVEVGVGVDQQDDGRVDWQAVQRNTDAGLEKVKVLGSSLALATGKSSIAPEYCSLIYLDKHIIDEIFDKRGYSFG